MKLSNIPNKEDFNLIENNKFSMIHEFIFDYEYDSYNDAFDNIRDELINEPSDYDFNLKDLELFILSFFD